MAGFADILRPVLPTTRELWPYLDSIEQTRIYSNFGPLYRQMKEQLAEYFMVEESNVALAANGTQALAGLVGISSTERSTWTVPSWTFVATAHAVKMSGREVALCDVDHKTWQLEPDGNRREILVLPFGAPLSNDFAARKTSSQTIIDAAASFDALRGIGLAAVNSHPIMISAHATKLVSMGEGGIVLGSPELVSDFERWMNFDFSGTRTSERYASNAKPSEYACAVGLAHLSKWERQRSSYFELLGWYQKFLPTEIEIQPSLSNKYISSTLVLTFPSKSSRDQFVILTTERGIATRMWWGLGIHKMPFWSAPSNEAFPVTDTIASKTIGVPFHLDLVEKDVEFICGAVSDAIEV